MLTLLKCDGVLTILADVVVVFVENENGERSSLSVRW